MLVGNDFLPHLPCYHINKNSLVDLYKAYIEVMPEHGNINELGVLNRQRLQIFLSKLAEMEKQKFKDHPDEFKIKKDDLKRCVARDEPDSAVAAQTNLDSVKSDHSQNDSEKDLAEEDGFERCKRVYYEQKLGIKNVDPECLKQLTFSYIEALQWNLSYYYDGCQSWSWCYLYHYAPYVSDMVGFDAFKENLSFELSAPFLPYEQLLSVMPIGSKRFLPESYQEMMCNEDSPLAGCYPIQFNLDLNGKRQLWEAVCLIPFINESKLKQASEIAKLGLTDEEKEHNQHKPQLLYTFSQMQRPIYPSSLPGVLPDITANHAECVELPYNEFHVPVDQLKKGISKKLKFQTHFYGFPSLKFLPFIPMIKNEKIRVFEQISKLDNVILKLTDVPDNSYLNLTKYLEKNIWYNFPYPKEGKLISIFDGSSLHMLRQTKTQTKYVKQRPSDFICHKYIRKVQEFKDQAMLKQGILIENGTALCQIRPVIGHSVKVNADGSIGKEKQFSSVESSVLGKTFMPRLRIVQPKLSLSDEVKAVDLYKIGVKCFLLDKRYYGDPSEIMFFNQQTNVAKVCVQPSYEPDLSEIVKNEGEILDASYLNQNELAMRLDVSPAQLKKIVGCFYVIKGGSKFKFNIGLQLKFKERRQCVLNYSIYFRKQWFFSNEVAKIIYTYMKRFPTVTSHIFNSDIQSNFDKPSSSAELFPMGKANEQFDELMKFLSDLPIKSERKISVDHRFLDRCLVRMIEDILPDSIKMLEKRKPTELSLNVSQVYCDLPVVTSRAHPDPNAVFKLYDRVVNVKGDFVVPQGLKGVVIGLEDNLDKSSDTMVTVCFDEPFEGAQMINTNDARAYVLPQCYLMNISHGKDQLVLSKSRRFNSQLPPIKHPRKEQFAFPNEQRVDPYYSGNYWSPNFNEFSFANSHQIPSGYYDYNSNYVPNPHRYKPDYHLNQPQRPRTYNPNQYPNQYPNFGSMNYQANYQANHQASHRTNYQVPDQQPSTSRSQHPPQTGEKHLDGWKCLMESANEALKSEKPNPFRHLTFNPTIKLTNNSRTASKNEKDKTLKSIEATEPASGKRDNVEKSNRSKSVKNCEKKPEVVQEKESDPVELISSPEDDPVICKVTEEANKETTIEVDATDEAPIVESNELAVDQLTEAEWPKLK